MRPEPADPFLAGADEPSRPSPAAPRAERDEFALIERELGVLLRRRLRLLALTGLQGRMIDGTGYAVLRRLVENGPMRLTALAGLIGLDTSTVSRQVAALTTNGLVERQRDPHDGRAYLLAPTAAGRDQLDEARAARCAVLRDLLASWGADDRVALAHLLSRLNDALDELAPRAADADDACPTAADDDTPAGGAASHLSESA